MKEVGNARIRPYGKGELIDAYCGECLTPRAGQRWLKNELEKYPGLMDRLVELGYTPRQRIFTCAQVKTIFEAIGEPGEN